ncbi:discoidin domain-containing protein [Alteromonas sp. PRIM-21]|uniref:discoidin domain-containing protein n=1 Tax=Alteromonas sp. PRIM-21 TaxID=1454978 RepID=UPI0022B9C0EA|nr:discoidin domain-containing protein [Alteromonas sp. PRIM-21]MCZ8531492.1 discoidin domain-containing protein [Alteromonas sp. PRIM-21]
MSFKKNFISELCASENLLDISGQCTAEQSSISRWSRGDDATRLLIDHDDEYANHTEYEVSPWVLIDMKQARKPAYIVIQNRDTESAGQVSKTVRVEYSLNGNDYSLIHDGEVIFGALPNSIPLILPLSKEVPFRYLRISLNSKDKVPLHLKRVNILIDEKPDLTQGQDNTTFYSLRNDGLGERLKSLLNAMVLSKEYQSEFKFTWTTPENLGPTHVIAAPDTTFSSEFLERHLIAEPPSDAHVLDKKPDFVNGELRVKSAIQVSQNSIYIQVPELKKHIPLKQFENAFHEIGFSDEVRDAIEYASKVTLKPNAVSVHLRSGDIVYGRYRHNDRYTNKVISWAQADFMVSSLKKQGLDVVLFGQSPQVCRTLADKYDCIYLNDHEQVQNFTALQLAFFDIILMSRTTRIFAGKSGFSQFAELIGGGEICAPDAEFDRAEMATHIEKLLNEADEQAVDDLQIAFSCWHYVYNFKDIVNSTQTVKLLEKGIEKDPDNLFYKIVLATLLFEKGDVDSAEDTISLVLSKRSDDSVEFGSYKYLKRHRHPDGKRALHRYEKTLTRMTESGVCGADILLKDLILNV